MSEKWIVFWITGSTRSGDRNAGMRELNTEEQARALVKEIGRTHGECEITLVRGEVVDTWIG